MKKSRRIALLALMFALIIIFNFVPISFGDVALGLMIIPVLLLAQVEDLKTTILLSLLLGVTNLISWYTIKAGSILAPVFQNPLVSILPRMMIGITTWSTTLFFKKFVAKPKYQKQISENGQATYKIENRKSIQAKMFVGSYIATALGVLTNTLLVGVMAVLLYNGKITAITPKFIVACFSVNFIIEIISFSFIIPPIVYAIRKLK